MVQSEFLEKVVIFGGLNGDQLERVRGYCREREFRYGNRLFREGEMADRQWIVAEGQVDLRFDLPGEPTSVKNTISSISAPEPFGWSGLVEPNRYRLSAYCATRRCKVVTIRRDDLVRLFDEDDGLGFKVMSNLANIIGRRFDHLAKSTKDAPYATVKITVHMDTCGIAAGARGVMAALLDEMDRVERPDIQVEVSGCIGNCSNHPNVTVSIEYQDPVVYQRMDSEKMRSVFRNHVLRGEVQNAFVLVET